MGRLRKLTTFVPALALAAGLISPLAANAADLLLEPEVIEAPEVPVKSSSGWYLRGDITYDFRKSDGGTYYPAAEMFTNVTFDDSYDVALGLGYQVSENFRVDLIGEYVFGSDWTGTSVDTNFVCAGMTTGGGGSVTTGYEPGTCTSNDTTEVSTIKVLANAYWDIGNFNGLTPYVGAGIGGAYVMYGDFIQDQTGTLTCCVAPTPNTVTHEGVDSWRFAYALHAGVSYDISYNWKIDVGYSYSDIAGGAMANYIGRDVPQAYDKGFTDHVVRAGVRYQIW